jgi:hypothetical protein
MLMVALEGDPGITCFVPWLTPSSMKFTDPVGGDAPCPAVFEVITAVTESVLPGFGVNVAGVTVNVVALGSTSTTTGCECAAA